MKKVLLNILYVSFLITSLFSCIEDPSISPGVKGADVPVFEGGAKLESDRTTAYSVTVTATITSTNGSKIESRGFCWGKNPSPTKENGGAEVPDMSGDVGIGTYTLTINGLENGEGYYIIPYADNSEGRKYGSPALFVSTNLGLGEVITIEPTLSEKRASEFKAGAEIKEEGEAKIDSIGIYLYLREDSAAIDTKTVAPNSEDKKYSFDIKGLNPSTKYYIQAFAKNKYGTFYGGIVSVTTLDDRFDVDETKVISGFTDAEFSSSVSKGNDETVTIEERGFCWSKTPEPTISDSVRKCGKNTGEFSVMIENLEAQQGYYVRAYAINNFGKIVYGNVKPFTTLTDVPSVETQSIDESKIQNGNAEVKGIIIAKGMSEIIYSGICWATHDNPTEILDNYSNVSAVLGVPFTVQISGLKGGTRYYVRAYAKNDSGTTYGEVKSFLAPSIFDMSLKPLEEKRLANSTAYFVINGNLCLLGGDLGANNSDEFWLYNISTNDWSSRLPFNGGPAKWQSGVSYGSGAYIYGGFDGSVDEKAGLYYYNFDNNQWDPPIPGPDSITVCRALGYAFSNGVFYIGGMSGDTVKSDVWCYIAQSSWVRKANFPVAQYGGVAVVIDNIAYAGMGKNSLNECNGKLWTTADGATTWDYKTECTIYTGSILAGVACNKRLYVIDESYKILEYNPATDVWSIKSQLPASCSDIHCMYSVNNKIYIGYGTSKVSLVTYDPSWDN